MAVLVHLGVLGRDSNDLEHEKRKGYGDCLVAITEKDLLKKQEKNLALQVKIDTERAKRAQATVDAADELQAINLDAEAARLEAVLEEEKRLTKLQTGAKFETPVMESSVEPAVIKTARTAVTATIPKEIV